MSVITTVCDLLDEYHGEKQWSNGRPILDELIYTILSQNTSAANSDRAYESLVNRFETWQAVAGSPVEDIASAIKSGGLANIKAPRIKNILLQIGERQHGDTNLDWLAELTDKEAVDYLLGFEGVGRKTAACVLMFSLGRPALPVDTHVHRVAMRLGLIEKVSADAAHDLLAQIVPAERIYSFHINMVAHGRQVCHARGPKCSQCVLDRICRWAGSNKGG
ncbi:MAG: endonuclease III [Armatimonadetes bacterium]|nr:endonuclease III [Armatimonadota bacterium]